LSYTYSLAYWRAEQEDAMAKKKSDKKDKKGKKKKGGKK